MPEPSGDQDQTVLIFFPDGYIGVAPTIRNLAELLAEAGARVEILGWQTGFPEASGLHRNVRVHTFRRPWSTRPGRVLARVLRRLDLEPLIASVDISWFLIRALPTILRLRAGGAWSATIGVDGIGSIVAVAVDPGPPRPLAYLSLELPDPFRHDPVSRLIQRLHREALGRADMVMIQDADRYEALLRHVRTKTVKPHFIPNSPRGSAHVVANDQDFLRERLGIEQSTFPTIVLQAGMIDDVTYSRDLARAFTALDNGCALVMHERVARRPDEPYIRELRRSNPRNLFLSLEPVDMDRLDLVYASATIGVAFYRDIDPNFGRIALASGKIAYYLKHGVPLIVNDLPSLRAFMTTHDVGVVVADPSDAAELEEAVRAILGDLERFRQNARRTFEQHLDFDALSRPAVEAILGGGSDQLSES